MAINGRFIPFQEAIDFQSGKVNMPTQRFDDLQREAHARGFSVAGVQRDDMLADFRRAIEKARTEGTGFAEFRKDFDAIVDKTGWKFNARGGTEEERRAWRAYIIYTTNMRTSFMAGRYKQLTDPDVLAYRPWWQYRHSGARHPRQTHLALNGLVFAATDPMWNVYYPPNGFGCGCDVVALSKRDMARLGKTGADAFPLPGSYPGIDPRTGGTEVRYPGIDRGWEYNVGQNWLLGSVPQELRTPLAPFGTPKPTPDLPQFAPPVTVTADDLLDPQASIYSTIKSFMGEFGLLPGDAREYRDASGGLITISDRLFDTRDETGAVINSKADKNNRGVYAKLIARAIIEPDEIWADWVDFMGNPVLRRAYLKRFELPQRNRSIFVRFEWTSKGWVAVTGFDTRESYIQKYRTGALLWRKD